MKRTLLLTLALGLTTHAPASEPIPNRKSQIANQKFTVTAYCPCAKCCGHARQKTADGHTPRAGVTCAAPRSIPFGTILNVPGLGPRTVQDRTARRFDGRIDIFFPTHAQAKAFGIQHLTVAASR